MKNSVRIKKFESKVSEKEFGKPYSELSADNKDYVDTCVADLMSEYYENLTA